MADESFIGDILNNSAIVSATEAHSNCVRLCPILFVCLREEHYQNRPLCRVSDALGKA